MSRRGDGFHRLVEQIERAVSNDPSITIESPSFRPDKVTGEPREHDIVLTYRGTPHRETVVAIECRDRGRPVDSPQVEGFRTKCQDTGVDKGVIVSSRGFAGPARKKAERYNIDCLTLEEVSRVDWCLADEITIRRRELRHAHLSVGVPVPLEDGTWRLFFRSEDGCTVEIDTEKQRNLLDWLFHKTPDPTSDLTGVSIVEIGNAQDFFVTVEDGIEHPVEQVTAELAWEAFESVTPLTSYRYGDVTRRAPYESVATGIESYGEIAGRLMFVRAEDGTIRLQFLGETVTPPMGTRRLARRKADKLTAADQNDAAP